MISGLKCNWIHESISKLKICVFTGYSDSLTSCRFIHNDPSLILTGSVNRSITLWSISREKLLLKLEHEREVSEVFPSPVSKNNFLSCGWDEKLIFWDLNTADQIWNVDTDGISTSCALSIDHSLAASGSDRHHTVFLWDTKSGQCIHRIPKLHDSTVTRVRFDPSSNRLISTSMDKTIKFWDIRSQCNTLTLKHHQNVVSSCDITPDGHKLVACAWDRNISVWDISTGNYRSKGPIVLQRGHAGCISSCKFAKNGGLVVSGGFDGVAVIWDANLAVKKLHLQGHKGWINDIDISSDGKKVITASNDKSVRFWDCEKAEDVPMAIDNKKSIGLNILTCKLCHNPFSAAIGVDIDEESHNICVFCRLKARENSSPMSTR